MDKSKYKNSGRSTRMLNRALDLVEAGKDVVIGIHKANFQNTLFKLVEEQRLIKLRLRAPTTFVNIRSQGSITFRVVLNNYRFSWDSLRFRGMSDTAIVLIDHYALEQHFGEVINMYLSYLK